MGPLPRIVAVELLYRMLFIYGNPEDYQKTIALVLGDESSDHILICPNATSATKSVMASGKMIMITEDLLHTIVMDLIRENISSGVIQGPNEEVYSKFGFSIPRDTLEHFFEVTLQYTRAIGYLTDSHSVSKIWMHGLPFRYLLKRSLLESGLLEPRDKALGVNTPDLAPYKTITFQLYYEDPNLINRSRARYSLSGSVVSIEAPIHIPFMQEFVQLTSKQFIDIYLEGPIGSKTRETKKNKS